MIDLIDGPKGKDDWGQIDWNKEEVWFEESDSKQPLTTSLVIFRRGKYEGSYLSEVSDTWYLEFIMEKNRNDFFITQMFTKRLGELKE